MVHPSCVQTPSIAVNALALVRDSRNRPAFDSTRTAPPTSASADPSTATRTPPPVNWPALTASNVATLLGDDGEDDEPLQAANSDASVAIDAALPASPQKRRREMRVSISDIALIASVCWGDTCCP